MEAKVIYWTKNGPMAMLMIKAGTEKQIAVKAREELKRKGLDVEKCRALYAVMKK